MKTKIVLVSAAWCGACQAIKEYWGALEPVLPNSTTVEIMDISEPNDRIDEFVVQQGISSLPVVLFIEDGSVVLKHTGSITMREVIAKAMALWQYAGDEGDD